MLVRVAQKGDQDQHISELFETLAVSAAAAGGATRAAADIARAVHGSTIVYDGVYVEVHRFRASKPFLDAFCGRVVSLLPPKELQTRAFAEFVAAIMVGEYSSRWDCLHLHARWAVAYLVAAAAAATTGTPGGTALDGLIRALTTHLDVSRWDNFEAALSEWSCHHHQSGGGENGGSGEYASWHVGSREKKKELDEALKPFADVASRILGIRVWRDWFFDPDEDAPTWDVDFLSEMFNELVCATVPSIVDLRCGCELSGRIFEVGVEGGEDLFSADEFEVDFRAKLEQWKCEGQCTTL